MPGNKIYNRSEKANLVANRPSLQVVYGILHSSLVVFAHVLVHV